MDIITPITITESMLNSNVAASTVDLYDQATVYTKGVQVRVTVDGIDKIFSWQSTTNSVSGVDTYPPENCVYKLKDISDASGLVWLAEGAVNRHAMFDGLTMATTTNEDFIYTEISIDEFFNSIGIVNPKGKELRIIIIDGTAGVLFDELIDMVDLEDSVDFYTWCFNPPARKKIIVITGLPLSYDTRVQFTLTETGEIVEVGELVFGMSKNIGKLLNGYSVGLQDYSIKTKDDSGIPVLVPGPYSDDGNLDVKIERSKITDIRRTLAKYRVKPLLWIGEETYSETIIYGPYTDFEVTVQTARHGYCTIHIEEQS